MALITPGQSLTKGAVVSPFVGLVAAVIVCVGAKLVFDLTFVTRMLFVPAWTTVSVTYFLIGLFMVTFQGVAVRQWLGDKTDDLYINGYHWRMWPFEKALGTPGPDQNFFLAMPATEPEGKDTVKVYIGSKENALVEIIVFSPLLYTGTDDPEHLVTGSYGNHVRQLVNQQRFGLGLLEDKALLEDYLELPPHPDHPINKRVGMTFTQHDRDALIKRYTDIRERMLRLKTKRKGPDQVEVEYTVFEPEGVDAVMARAGRFVEELWENGMHPRKMLAPSMDPSITVDAAANEKEVQRHKNEVLAMKAGAQRDQALAHKDALGITGEDALDRIGMIEGQDVSRNIFGVSGLQDFLKVVGGAAAIYIASNTKTDGAKTPEESDTPKA